MKKVIIMIILLTYSQFASATMPYGNIVDKFYLKPIVIDNMIPGGRSIIPMKGFYIKILDINLERGNSYYSKKIYISTVWFGILLFGIFYFIFKYRFKKQK